MKLRHGVGAALPESEGHRTQTPVGNAYDAVSDTDIWVGHGLPSGRAEKSEK